MMHLTAAAVLIGSATAAILIAFRALNDALDERERRRRRWMAHPRRR